MNDKKALITNFQGIRGYAILFIFISHCSGDLSKYGVYLGYFGAFGVSLFIMLSGCLLLQNHSNSLVALPKYFGSKIMKFYPLHLATMLVALPFIVKGLIALEPSSWLALLANIFLVQSWVPITGIYFSLNGVAWYLSLTMFFVLISPLVLRLWQRLKNINIFVIILFCLLVDFFWCYAFNDTKIAHWIIYVFPLIRSLEFVLGGGDLVFKRTFKAIKFKPKYAWCV